MKELTDRQRLVLQFILGEMEANGFPPTVREIGDQFAITPKGAYDHIKAIEKKGYIKCHKNRSRAIEVLVHNDSRILKSDEKVVWVPLLGTVAAGSPIMAEENIEEYVPFPKSMAGTQKTYTLRVKGDSMKDAGILNGDLALIKYTTTAQNGDIVVALIEGEATLKTFKKEKGQVKLIPANKSFKVMTFKKVEIIGKLLGIMRYY